ncbi:MAG: PEGA domain-containing protein [Chitinispirillales bacterium]|nr:PEGA domain-containing protein [Chitinispirillales bacterium]
MFKKLKIAVFFAVINGYAGFVEINSSPSGAKIIINDKETGLTTPKVVEIKSSSAQINVSLENYNFRERTIFVPAHDTVRLSFTQMQISDTISIFGDRSHGILNLPSPPDGIPYLIDGYIENDSRKILLNAGEHNVYWNGGIEYEPIDTFVEVEVGKIANVDFAFNYRTATLFVETEPEEAKIFLDGKLAGVGILFCNTKAGKHNISISYRGYRTNEQEITILPDRMQKLNIKLERLFDNDDVNKCLDIYGTYEDCPKNKKIDELKKLGKFLGDYLNRQPFSIEASAISVQYRTATDKKFRDIVSLFNDGTLIGTNYRGFSFFNKLWIAKSFVIVSAEYGQGFGGVKYKKPYQIDIGESSPEYKNCYLIYDEFLDVNPELFFNSYSGQIGFRAGDRGLSIAILVGYLREKITLNGISKKIADDRYEYLSIEKRNDTWITSLRAVIAPKAVVFCPSIYAELSLTPVSGYDVSGWVSLRTGVIIPWWYSKQ